MKNNEAVKWQIISAMLFVTLLAGLFIVATNNHIKVEKQKSLELGRAQGVNAIQEAMVLKGCSGYFKFKFQNETYNFVNVGCLTK